MFALTRTPETVRLAGVRVAEPAITTTPAPLPPAPIPAVTRDGGAFPSCSTCPRAIVPAVPAPIPIPAVEMMSLSANAPSTATGAPTPTAAPTPAPAAAIPWGMLLIVAAIVLVWSLLTEKDE